MEVFVCSLCDYSVNWNLKAFWFVGTRLVGDSREEKYAHAHMAVQEFLCRSSSKNVNVGG